MKSTASFVAKLLCFALLLNCQKGHSQQCSRDALTAKYWQYRQTLNDHFIMIDRTPEGCIGNGITTAGSSSQQITCETELLHGLSLLATSIIMSPNGGWGMEDRNLPESIFFDPSCADYPADHKFQWRDESVYCFRFAWYLSFMH